VLKQDRLTESIQSDFVIVVEAEMAMSHGRLSKWRRGPRSGGTGRVSAVPGSGILLREIWFRLPSERGDMFKGSKIAVGIAHRERIWVEFMRSSSSLTDFRTEKSAVC
jgi:hypothetical protein